MAPMYEHDVLNSCMEILHEILYGFCMQLLYGHHVWKSCMACLYGDLVRMSRVEIKYEIHVRTYAGKMLYGSVAWKCCTDV